MKEFRIAIRLDADSQIGAGHFFRCFSLALAFQRARANSQITFLGAIEGDGLLKRIQDAGFHFSKASDLREEVELLIVDHYGIDKFWEERSRSKAQKILVIDDTADRRHDCDYLLDQNFCIDPELRYQKLIPKNAKRFLGPKFALLRKEFLERRSSSSKRNFSVAPQNVLVCFGGGDAPNQTERVADILLNIEVPKILLVLGPTNKNSQRLKSKYMSNPKIELFQDVTDMAMLLAGVEVAIVSGGSLLWELCCFGIPTFSVPIADNQMPIARSLSEAGALLFAGHYSNVTDLEIREKMQDLIRSSEIRSSLSQNAIKFVDGLGAQRVTEEILKDFP